MSAGPIPSIRDVDGVVGNGRARMSTTTTLGVRGRCGTVTLQQVAAKPQARDTVLTSKLNLSEARALRDELDQAIANAE